MRTYLLDEQSAFSDWRYVFAATDINGWTANDYVVVGITPEAATWDDYGMFQSTFTPFATVKPFMTWSSDDGSNYVTLTDPNTIDIQIPGTQMQRLGVGTVNVGISLRRKDTGSQQTLVSARLPLVYTVV